SSERTPEARRVRRVCAQPVSRSWRRRPRTTHLVKPKTARTFCAFPDLSANTRPQPFLAGNGVEIHPGARPNPSGIFAGQLRTHAGSTEVASAAWMSFQSVNRHSGNPQTLPLAKSLFMSKPSGAVSPHRWIHFWGCRD